MAKLNADTATRQFKKALNDKLSINLLSKSSDKVIYEVTYKATEQKIEAFFDINAQLFGFKMFNDGIKTYPEVTKCVEMLTVYMYINTDLVPTAKEIVQMYATANGLNTKYMTFTGSVTDGFTTQFEVAGQPRFIFVSENKPHEYKLNLVESVDKKKYRTLDSLIYFKTENGFEKRLTVLAISNNLYDRCLELGEDYVFNRVAANGFTFSYGDLELEFELKLPDSIEDDSIEYHITKINGEEKSCDIVLEDYLDLDALVATVLDRMTGKIGNLATKKVDENIDVDPTNDESDAVPLDEIDFEESDTTAEDENVDETDIDAEMQNLDAEIEQSDDNVEDSMDDIESEENEELSDSTEDLFTPSENIDIENADGIMDENIEYTENVTDDTNENEEVTDTENNSTEPSEEEQLPNALVTESEQYTQESGEFTTMKVTKLIRDDSVVGLMFELEDGLYIADIESLKDSGIPYNRIVDSETEVKKNGYYLWETEQKQKRFAQNVSNDIDQVHKLVSMMF